MAIALDNVATAVGVNVTSLQWTHTAAASGNMYILASICATPLVSAGDSISTCAFNGVALTRKGKVFQNGIILAAEMWSKAAPNSGALTMSCVASQGCEFLATTTTWSGVSQGAPDGNPSVATTGSVTVCNLSVSSTATAVVVACNNIFQLPGTFTIPAGQTILSEISGSYERSSVVYKVASGATTSFSWSSSAAKTHFAIGVAISNTAVAAGSTFVPSLPLLGVGQ